ncbi:hypothetical protein HY256_10575 [Candidatus Sumerlaeota bacterium]|nr:hypothetical protein [Candidatus Sumerlaeota bacterium]
MFAYASSRFSLYSLTMGFIEHIMVTAKTLQMTVILGLSIGLVSGIWPAFRASGMTITEAIRRLD